MPASSKVVSYLHGRQRRQRTDNALNLPAFINLCVLKKLMSHPALGSPCPQPAEVTTGGTGGAYRVCGRHVYSAVHHTCVDLHPHDYEARDLHSPRGVLSTPTMCLLKVKM